MLHWFFRLGEHLVNKVPIPVIEAVWMECMIALRKPAGGVEAPWWGTWSGGSWHAQWSTGQPYQYALSTRAGCECVSHVVQALCEANPNTTIVSVDGVSAYDTISPEAMMHGLLDMEGGESVSAFRYDNSTVVFHNICGRTMQEFTHTIFQGEGGEQGDPLMPMLCSLGQHRALEAIDRSLRPDGALMAFLDDVFAVTPGPDRVGAIYGSNQENMWVHSSTWIDGGKNQVWNGGEAGHLRSVGQGRSGCRSGRDKSGKCLKCLPTSKG